MKTGIYNIYKFHENRYLQDLQIPWKIQMHLQSPIRRPL